jgi:hypothetical protein
MSIIESISELFNNIYFQILIIVITAIIEILVLIFPNKLLSDPYKYAVGILISLDILVLIDILKEI